MHANDNSRKIVLITPCIAWIIFKETQQRGVAPVICAEQVGGMRSGDAKQRWSSQCCYRTSFLLSSNQALPYVLRALLGFRCVMGGEYRNLLREAGSSLQLLSMSNAESFDSFQGPTACRHYYFVKHMLPGFVKSVPSLHPKASSTPRKSYMSSAHTCMHISYTITLRDFDATVYTCAAFRIT